jgi:hypothetical protein
MNQSNPSTHLVERLKEGGCGTGCDALCREAGSYIEGLQESYGQLLAENVRLRAALEVSQAAERGRWPDRFALADAILRAWKKHGQDSWCAIADDVLREFGPNVGDKPPEGSV